MDAERRAHLWMSNEGTVFPDLIRRELLEALATAEDALADARGRAAAAEAERDEWRRGWEVISESFHEATQAKWAAEERARVLWAALADLVYLKDEIHDTPEYHERKEPAWQAARDALAAQQPDTEAHRHECKYEHAADHTRPDANCVCSCGAVLMDGSNVNSWAFEPDTEARDAR